MKDYHDVLKKHGVAMDKMPAVREDEGGAKPMMYEGGLHIRFRDQSKDPIFVALNKALHEVHAEGKMLTGAPLAGTKDVPPSSAEPTAKSS